jgi:hypothetical protein
LCFQGVYFLGAFLTLEFSKTSMRRNFYRRTYPLTALCSIEINNGDRCSRPNSEQRGNPLPICCCDEIDFCPSKTEACEFDETKAV